MHGFHADDPVLHPQLGGLRHILGGAGPGQAIRAYRGSQALLDRRYERLRAVRVEGVLSPPTAPGQIAVAVQQQPVEGRDLRVYGLGPELRFSRPPFGGQAALLNLLALLLTAFFSRTPFLLAHLSRCLPLSFPLLLGGGTLSLLLLPYPGLSGTLFFPPLLRGLLGRLGRFLALVLCPRPAGLLFELLPLQLHLLVSLIHLRDQRFASGHQLLQAGRTTHDCG